MKKLILVAAAAAILFIPSYRTVAAAKAAQSTVFVTVQHVAQIDNLDFDLMKADRADFYVQVGIDSVCQRSSTIWGRDVIRPMWRLGRPVSGNVINMHLRLYDDDFGIAGGDDRCDINPLTGARELMFTYNIATGRIRGDVDGYAGVPIHVKGFGDANRSEITFVVDHR